MPACEQPCIVPQYRNVSAVVKLRVVGMCCHTSCSTCTMHGIVRVALSHCAFSTSLVDFHTLYDQPFGPRARVFSFSPVFTCSLYLYYLNSHSVWQRVVCCHKSDAFHAQSLHVWHLSLTDQIKLRQLRQAQDCTKTSSDQYRKQKHTITVCLAYTADNGRRCTYLRPP